MNNFKPDPINTAVNKSIFDMAVTALLKSTRVEFPFLNIPIIGQIFDRLILAVANSIFDYLQKLVTFQVITFQTEHELNNYNKAASELKAAIEKGNKDEIQSKQANFEKTFGDLIGWEHK